MSAIDHVTPRRAIPRPDRSHRPPSRVGFGRPGGVERPRPPLTDAQRELAARWTPLAIKVAHEIARSRPWLRDELESRATWALCDAARKYDPGAGIPFGRGLRHEIAMRLRAALPTLTSRPHATLDDLDYPPMADDPGHGAVDDADAFEHRIRPLPPRDRDILRWSYRDGLTDGEIADRLGLTRGRVSQVRRAALATLRAAMGA